MEKVETVKKSLEELAKAGAEDALLEVEMYVSNLRQRISSASHLNVNRVRLFAIDHGFSFEANGTVVIVRGEKFVVKADTSTKEFDVRGLFPFSEEEFFAGMSRFDFGEKHGFNSQYLKVAYNETFEGRQAR